jgi:hypothetical protein
LETLKTLVFMEPPCVVGHMAAAPHTCWCVNDWHVTDLPADSIARFPGGIPSLSDFFTQPASQTRFCVYAWESDGKPNHKQLAGLAAVSLGKAVGRFAFEIHALTVRPSSMNRGAKELLYRSMHEAAYEVAQWELNRSGRAGDKEMQVMTFTLRQGSCRVDDPDTLLLLQGNGWSIHTDASGGGVLVRTRDEIVTLLAGETPLQLSVAPYTVNSAFLYSSVQCPPKLSPSPAGGRVDAGKGNSFNAALLAGEAKMGPGSHLPSKSTGILAMFVPAAFCRSLDFYLSNLANRGVMPSQPYPVSYLQVGSRRISGFGRYDNVQAPTHSYHQQAALTFRTNTKADVLALLDFVPGFKELTNTVVMKLGYPVEALNKVGGPVLLHVHFFYVDISRQTSFAWHSDDEDLQLYKTLDKKCLITAVFQLGAEACTAMQVHGFSTFFFAGRGAAAIFHGSTIHRSVNLDLPPHTGVWKVSLFLKLPEKDTLFM